MQAVHVVQGDKVDVLLHELGWEEVARAVEHHAAVGEAGRRLHLGGGQLDALGALEHGQRLADGLHAVEHACGRSARDGDTTLVDNYLVGLRSQLGLGVEHEADAGLRLALGGLLAKLELGHVFHVLREERGVALHVGIARGVVDDRGGRQREVAALGVIANLVGCGYHLGKVCFLCRAHCREARQEK